MVRSFIGVPFELWSGGIIHARNVTEGPKPSVFGREQQE